jgi:hypothetical protein
LSVIKTKKGSLFDRNFFYREAQQLKNMETLAWLALLVLGMEKVFSCSPTKKINVTETG